MLRYLCPGWSFFSGRGGWTAFSGSAGWNSAGTAGFRQDSRLASRQDSGFLQAGFGWLLGRILGFFRQASGFLQAGFGWLLGRILGFFRQASGFLQAGFGWLLGRNWLLREQK
ncbi:hypothetical protein ACFFRR_001159 [Megaselia abdita]